MKTTEIVGFKREDLGTASSKALRADGNVPCVVYGGKDVIHFHSPAYLFKDLLYTPEAFMVKLNVEGIEKTSAEFLQMGLIIEELQTRGLKRI